MNDVWIKPELFLQNIKEIYPSLTNIFEVGCHNGRDIEQIRLFWPDANIYAFEADPYNYKSAKSRVASDSKAFVYHLAVTDHTGTIEFNRFFDVESIPLDMLDAEDNVEKTGQGSILDLGKGMKDIFKIEDVYEKISVPCTSLSDFCKSNDIDKIDAILLDVQGAEKKALDGCGNFLMGLSAVVFEWSKFIAMYEGESDYYTIKSLLESVGMSEIAKEYQIEGISGDSAFVRDNRRSILKYSYDF